MDSGDAMREVLRERFGFSEFRAGQEQVIGRLLEGKSVLAIFPTGAGKSMGYQLPALMIEESPTPRTNRNRRGCTSVETMRARSLRKRIISRCQTTNAALA